MRKLLTVAVGLGLTTLAIAQNPAQPKLNLTPVGQNNPVVAAPAPVKLDPANNRLDSLLLQWEQKMKTVNALEATVERTDIDATEKTTKVYKGVAKFMRPSRAYLRLQRTTDPNIFEQFVFTGTHLYEYQSQLSKLNIHEVAPKAGQMIDDNFLNFLFGMKAIDAKQRYTLTLYKEDENYILIFIDPKEVSDLQEFRKARLALYNSTFSRKELQFLPRQLEFEAPNGNVVKWDIPICNPNAKLTATDFTPPQPPKEWHVTRVPRQTPGVTPLPQNPTTQPPPTKVRPNGGS